MSDTSSINAVPLVLPRMKKKAKKTKPDDGANQKQRPIVSLPVFLEGVTERNLSQFKLVYQQDEKPPFKWADIAESFEYQVVSSDMGLLERFHSILSILLPTNFDALQSKSAAVALAVPQSTNAWNQLDHLSSTTIPMLMPNA
jgi:hypothetical protein